MNVPDKSVVSYHTGCLRTWLHFVTASCTLGRRMFHIASFPSRVGGEKSGLVSTACACTTIRGIFRKIVSFDHVVIPRGSYFGQSRSNLCTHTPTLKAAVTLSCQICHSGVQPKYSTVLSSDVGLQEDWPSHLRMYFLCLLKMAPFYQHITAALV